MCVIHIQGVKSLIGGTVVIAAGQVKKPFRTPDIWCSHGNLFLNAIEEYSPGVFILRFGFTLVAGAIWYYDYGYFDAVSVEAALQCLEYDATLGGLQGGEYYNFVLRRMLVNKFP